MLIVTGSYGRVDGFLEYDVGELRVVIRLRVELVECENSDENWVCRERVVAEGEKGDDCKKRRRAGLGRGCG